MSKNNKLKHDEYFRKSLSNLVIAKEFLDDYLPENVNKIVNTDNLKLE